MFFLGEMLTDLPLPVDERHAHCGQCSACIDGLPDRRHRRPLQAGCAALHLLSDHRTEGRIPEDLRR
jgi:epoxyqueuosine reductase